MYKFIDPDLVNSRVEEWGGKDMVVDIVGMLEEGFLSSLDELKQAVAQRDFSKIKDLVHPLKSNFYYFFDRNTDFGKKIQEFENKGKDHDPTMLDEYLQLFVTNGEQTIEELKDYVSNF